MKKTIEEIITADIETRLRAMTQVNGYSKNYKVQRRRRIGNDADNYAIVLIDGSKRLHELQSLGRDRWIKEYQVRIPLMSGDDATATAEGDVRSRFLADVVTALQSTYTRGGYALDTRVTQSDPIDDTDMAGELIAVEVHFWTSKDDPYSQ